MRNLYVLKVVNVNSGDTIETLYYTNAKTATASFYNMVARYTREHKSRITMVSTAPHSALTEIQGEDTLRSVALFTESIESGIFKS